MNDEWKTRMTVETSFIITAFIISTLPINGELIRLAAHFRALRGGQA